MPESTPHPTSSSSSLSANTPSLIESDKSDKKVYLWAVMLNLAYVVVELGFGFAFNSLALLADATHNFADVINILIVWLGSWIANRPSNAERTYGYRRVSLLSSLYIGLAMMGVATTIVWHGIERFMQATVVDQANHQGLMITMVAGFGVAINLISAYLFAQAQKKSKDISHKALAMELFYDGLVSVGVIIGGLLLYWFGWAWIDAALAIGLAIFILWSAVGLIHETVNLLLDAVPSHVKLSEVQALILDSEGVTGIHDLHIWAMSARNLSLTAHVTAPNGLSDEALKKLWHAIEHTFGIDHITIQVERDEAHCPQLNHLI